MRRLLITFATPLEAQATLELTKATPNGLNNYNFDRGYISITGMGSIAAATKVTAYAEHIDEVWNCGIAGTFRNHPIGYLEEITTVSKLLPASHALDAHSHSLTMRTFPPVTLSSEKGASLLTSDFPIHDLTLREQYAKEHCFVDMEGYGIAFAAQQAQRPCRIWKVTSDFSSPDGHALIKTHLASLSQQIAHFLTDCISST